MHEDIAQKLEDRIRRGTAVVGVAGLGYVGTEVARACSRRFKVVGYDVDQARAKALSSAGAPAGSTDPGLLGDADIVLICAPTPLKPNRQPDLEPLTSCTETVARHLRRGSLVVCESTTFPSTTEEHLVPILEHGGMQAGVDFLVAHSPERIDPGNTKWGIDSIPKIVGGLTPEAGRVAAQFYRSFLKAEVHEVRDCRTAEASKMLENIFRHVNIALANELAVAFEQLGVSYWEAVEAAATKPFGFMPFLPGPGAGGHCIPLDPAYFRHRAAMAGHQPRLLAVSDDINEMMPYHVVKLVHKGFEELGGRLRGSRIAMLGLTYKPDVADVRESAALKVLSLILDLRAEVAVHDPYVSESPVHHKNVSYFASAEDAVRGADCVLIATGHTAFRSLDLEGLWRTARRPLLVDCVGLLRAKPPAGWSYYCVGEPAPRPATG